MNKYEKLGVIGEGTYGVVMKCKHKESGEVVAVKKFKPPEDDDEEFSKKLELREVKLLKAMDHENIVHMKEAFRRKGTLYVVFEFIETCMMDMLQANPNGVEPETVRLLTCQLARALEHCHRRNVVHRDIKPENLLVSPKDSSLRLCDFGCARKLTTKDPMTDYVATRWYRAPELLLSSTSYGKGVDMWGLGCIMGELFDGQPLFAGQTDVDQLCIIQKMLGPMTPEQMKMCMDLSGFQNIKFPEGSQQESLERRYSKMSELQLQFIKTVLVMDSERRPTARAALRMPWLDGLRPKKEKEVRPREQSKQSSGTARPETGESVPASVAPRLKVPSSACSAVSKYHTTDSESQPQTPASLRRFPPIAKPAANVLAQVQDLSIEEHPEPEQRATSSPLRKNSHEQRACSPVRKNSHEQRASLQMYMSSSSPVQDQEDPWRRENYLLPWEAQASEDLASVATPAFGGSGVIMLPTGTAGGGVDGAIGTAKVASSAVASAAKLRLVKGKSSRWHGA